MKCNEYPKYFKTVGNVVYASHNKIWWFFYTDMECC